MVCVAQLLAAADQLPGDEARREVEVLLGAVLGRPRSYLFAWPEATVPQAQVARFKELLAARQAGRPLAYLLGEREFWGLPLRVSEATLIPRADTESLVEAALELPLVPDAALRVLDLGTGSGAIALALARERDAWQVTGVDVSAEALSVARENARALGLHGLRWLEGSWFEPAAGEHFHLIVSNPPYLAQDDPHLACGDLRFEPATALVAGQDGYAALAHLVATAPAHLETGGWLVLEHGMAQGTRVRDALGARGFVAVASRRDLAGHERVSLGRWEGEGC